MKKALLVASLLAVFPVSYAIACDDDEAEAETVSEPDEPDAPDAIGPVVKPIDADVAAKLKRLQERLDRIRDQLRVHGDDVPAPPRAAKPPVPPLPPLPPLPPINAGGLEIDVDIDIDLPEINIDIPDIDIKIDKTKIKVPAFKFKWKWNGDGKAAPPPATPPPTNIWDA